MKLNMSSLTCIAYTGLMMLLVGFCKETIQLENCNSSAPSKDKTVEGIPYIGCFNSSCHNIQINLTDPNMTIAMCTSYCKNTTYDVAGVSHGSRCSCGDYTCASHKSCDSRCGIPCSGNITLQCGGRNWVQLYRVSLPSESQDSSWTGYRLLAAVLVASFILLSSTCFFAALYDRIKTRRRFELRNYETSSNPRGRTPSTHTENINVLQSTPHHNQMRKGVSLTNLRSQQSALTDDKDYNHSPHSSQISMGMLTPITARTLNIPQAMTLPSNYRRNNRHDFFEFCCSDNKYGRPCSCAKSHSCASRKDPLKETWSEPAKYKTVAKGFEKGEHKAVLPKRVKKAERKSNVDSDEEEENYTRLTNKSSTLKDNMYCSLGTARSKTEANEAKSKNSLASASLEVDSRKEKRFPGKQGKEKKSKSLPRFRYANRDVTPKRYDNQTSQVLSGEDFGALYNTLENDGEIYTEPELLANKLSGNVDKAKTLPRFQYINNEFIPKRCKNKTGQDVHDNASGRIVETYAERITSQSNLKTHNSPEYRNDSSTGEYSMPCHHTVEVEHDVYTHQSAEYQILDPDNL